jgi:F0F1-type ATP synthase epsilon subunit
MFTVRLISLQDELYTGLAQEVILPTKDGQLTILDFHQPIVSRLSAGVICIDKRKIFKIKDGIIKMSGIELMGIVQT